MEYARECDQFGSFTRTSCQNFASAWNGTCECQDLQDELPEQCFSSGMEGDLNRETYIMRQDVDGYKCFEQ